MTALHWSPSTGAMAPVSGCAPVPLAAAGGNGKVERFNRTLLDEWAYQRPYTSHNERTGARADLLHTYDHHRCHTALGGHPPLTRVNNPAGQYT
ncbi:hypothetical protein SLAV_02465 [Streptomyces lavendulae subsp. lavendulae]|uniref:Uncharacterized protein n=1 Tax=Streptomyces lavendulae subsp. lavendulae TaxID=58340 RepID=A0A2K8P6P0_STRLA|nr:hypothetical protein SLAV_02465 [Streptomyces lavendulae subsp. lavendulae]QUQ52261.1 hypothetical protein SLLC_00495 [Streptomyces lavendulae subsp. lavendulae]